MINVANRLNSRLLFSIVAPVVGLGFHPTPVFTQQQPNILWITIEDTSPEFIGCYGNNNAKTPVIDQLAAHGIRFTHAYSTGTVCSPSRSALITGVPTYKTGTGNHRSNYPIPEFIKGFPYYLQKEGYYASNNSKTDYNIGDVEHFIKEAWNESSDKAGWWNRKPGQPFFAVFNFNDSHQSRTMSNSYEWYSRNVLEQLQADERIAEDAFDMPPFYFDSPEMRKHFARVYNSIKLTDKRIGQLLEKLDADHLRDSTIIFFFADHGEGIPRVKTNGINLGHRVPFVIWFPEMYKHLSPWGSGGLVSEELISFEDLAPTLISLAGGSIPDYMCGRVILGNNRSPETTYLKLSNDRADNGPDLGRSITDGRFFYCRNFTPWVPEMRYIRYVEQADITMQMRSDLRGNKLNSIQKNIFLERPAEFLFDLETDPWETMNLVDNPKYRTQVRKLRKQLNKNIIASRDIHFLPEYEIGLISENETPYEFRLKEKNYPFKEIYAAASLSGQRSKKTMRKQIRLLQSDDKIIRYWAIQGLRAQDPNILKVKMRELKLSLDDPYLPVAATAAAIVFQLSRDQTAQNKLLSLCTHDNPDIALLAINHLLYIDDKKPFTEAVILAAKKHENQYQVNAACLDFLQILKTAPQLNKPD
jgi:arylsulfatase A-like enzyme